MIVYYSLSGSVSSWRSSSLSSSHWADWGRGLGLTGSGETQEEEMEDAEGEAGETGTLVWWMLLQGAKPSSTMCFHFKAHITEWSTSWMKSKAVLNHWNTSAWLPNTNLFSGTDSFFFSFFVWLICLHWVLAAAHGIFVASWGSFRCSNRIL